MTVPSIPTGNTNPPVSLGYTWDDSAGKWVGATGLTDAQLRASALGTSLNFIGSKSASTPTAVSVGTSSTQVLAANSARQGAVFVNTSANYISLGIGAAAVLYSGITLAPNGSFSMDPCSLSVQVVNAIASVAASNLGVQEFA